MLTPSLTKALTKTHNKQAMRHAPLFMALAVAATLVAVSGTARADVYPILTTYQEHTEELVALTQAAVTVEDLAPIEIATRELIDDGVGIMKLYSSRNPACLSQFEVFIQEVPTMENMSLPDVHARYHNGAGLPTAPRHCYFGRSQVVHPMMNLIRIHQAQASELTEDLRSDMIEDLREVFEHLPKIQKNLDNPPTN